MAIKNSLMFGGISSADYGIFISGEGAFNSPSRAVEMIDVPGRNGAIAIDQGRYENISVKYPVFVPASNRKEFRSKLSAFVNAIASQRGYQRLSDTYHPDEYRMALFVEQIEVEPVHYNTAGGFDLVFNCKPQRYLLSGEEEVTASSGDTLINPTLHEASPLLAVKGYGTIDFNGYEIEINDAVYGSVEVAQGENLVETTSNEITIDQNKINYSAGDPIIISNVYVSYLFWAVGLLEAYFNTADSITVTESGYSNYQTNIPQKPSTVLGFSGSLTLNNITFTAGQTGSISHETTITVPFRVDGSAPTLTAKVKVDVLFDGSDTININISISKEASDPVRVMPSVTMEYMSYPDIMCDSSMSYLGNPTYIDCDLGEAYSLDSGTLTPLNAYIDLGSDLPVLSPGENTITKSNTITELKITPRWWQI